MKSPARNIAVLVAGLVLAGGGVGAARLLHVGPWRPEDPGPVVARVDGRPIYLSQAEARLQGLASVHGDVSDSLGADWPQKVLQSLVDDVLIQEEAERRDIHLTDEEIAAALSQVRQDFPSGEAFDRWLEDQGMDLAELERRMTLNMLAARVYMAVTADVKVAGAEIRAYYRSHRSNYEGADGPTPLLEVRASIRDALEQQERDRAFAVWLDERRDGANVFVVLDGWWRNIP